MTGIILSAVHASRRNPLAACLASIFALSMPAVAIADTWTVDDCGQGSSGDAGLKNGTLRFALENAATPAVINMTGVVMAACPSSKISLTTGALTFNQDFVTINGPGAAVLQVDATGLGLSYGDKRVFTHYGLGKLTINDLGVTGGHAYHGDLYASQGGCVFSNGAVELNNASVTTCYARNVGANVAKGGAVYAKVGVTLINSTVSGNYARSVSADTFGGGVYAKGDIALTLSSVNDNGATSASGNVSGAGLFGRGDASLSASSLNFNVASTSGFISGGGLYAQGGAGLTDSFVQNNTVTSSGDAVLGGGVYLKGTLTLTSSVLSHNSVSGTVFSNGGSAAARGGLTIAYSTIDDNHAISPGGSAFAGGLYTSGDATLTSSTVSNNSSTGNVGGMNFFSGGSKTVTITNSTISGNSASGIVGGMYADAKIVNISNSTFAFNTASTGKSGSTYLAPGAAITVKTVDEVVTLQSSILSNNTYGSSENDLSTIGSTTIAGADNLVRVSSAGVPGDTLVSVCPLLGPLRDNGGPTKTHALPSNSPAIDAGNSTVVNDYEQRGSALTNGVLDYVRVSGPNGNPSPVADIGAYEVQQDKIIFTTGFDGCVST